MDAEQLQNKIEELESRLEKANLYNAKLELKTHYLKKGGVEDRFDYIWAALDKESIRFEGSSINDLKPYVVDESELPILFEDYIDNLSRQEDTEYFFEGVEERNQRDRAPSIDTKSLKDPYFMKNVDLEDIREGRVKIVESKPSSTRQYEQIIKPNKNGIYDLPRNGSVTLEDIVLGRVGIGR